MKAFMDESFLLSTPTAEILYHDYAAKMPIIDYHCHINPQEIAEDRKAENISQLWLGGDHYKWRLLRACGVPEQEVTGSADDKTKFMQFAAVLTKAIGNPVYHWAHLELKRYFGYHGVLNPDTAENVWQLTQAKMKELSVREIIRRSNVSVIVTTDDPVDDLKWHRMIAADTSFATKVLPGWRPDKALYIEKPDFADYLTALSASAGKEIHTFSDLKAALALRMNFFAENGCVVSDHGMDFVMYAPAAESVIESILARRLAGEVLSQEDINHFKYALLLFLAKEYSRRGWVMQIHYGAVRNTNSKKLQETGADTGFDCIGSTGSAAAVTALLNALEVAHELPKTILYSLNPNDDAMLDTAAGCFGEDGVSGKVQHGAAWWFNDTKAGIEHQLVSFANQSVLGNFVGMLTDSRSFLSYTRHEYFRRILCNLIGTWAENGELPNDTAYLGKLVCDISYYNAQKYFGF